MPSNIRAAKVATQKMRLGMRAVERRFTRDLAGIMRGIHDAVASHIEPALKELAAKTDNVKVQTLHPTGQLVHDLDGIMRTIIPQVGPKVSLAHDRMVQASRRNYDSHMKAVMPLGWKRLPTTVAMEAQIARDESIKLVENAARVYAQQVRDVFGNPEETLGVPYKQLQAKLMERGNVSESRAELIARDQTLKMNGAINRAQQTAAGIVSYVWNTSGDERVRDEHAALDGQTFDWSAPPDVGNPGEDFQCRCIGIPVLDLGED